MTVLTKRVLQKMILEELQHFNSHKPTLNKTPYIYLFKGKNKTPSKVSFSHLHESQKRGLISERQIIESWERSVDYELQCLLNEGIGDILAKGWEVLQKGGELAGKAYAAYSKALNKVSEFIENTVTGAMNIAKKGLSSLGPVMKKLSSMGEKIKGLAKRHPVLAKAATIVAFAGLFFMISSILDSNEAQAALTQGKQIVDSADADTAIGFIHNAVKEGNLSRELGNQAREIIEQGVLGKHEIPIENLDVLSGKAGKVAQIAFAEIQKLQDEATKDDTVLQQVLQTFNKLGKDFSKYSGGIEAAAKKGTRLPGQVWSR